MAMMSSICMICDMFSASPSALVDRHATAVAVGDAEKHSIADCSADNHPIAPKLHPSSRNGPWARVGRRERGPGRGGARCGRKGAQNGPRAPSARQELHGNNAQQTQLSRNEKYSCFKQSHCVRILKILSFAFQLL